jgi:DNA-directed RNA polymerase
MKTIHVCKGERQYFLRLHLETRDGEVMRFETSEEFTKSEADWRAMSLSNLHGFQRDELPTHPKVEPYPKREEGVKT